MTESPWRDFMALLRDTDAALVTLHDDGDITIASTRYRCGPLTDAERATAHRDHGPLLLAAAAKIQAVAALRASALPTKEMA